jgi:hypothetical protein
MPAAISADKSREELRHWHQTDPDGLVDYALDLQTELRRLRDAAAQNSRNSSRPPFHGPIRETPAQEPAQEVRPQNGRPTRPSRSHPPAQRHAHAR